LCYINKYVRVLLLTSVEGTAERRKALGKEESRLRKKKKNKKKEEDETNQVLEKKIPVTER